MSSEQVIAEEMERERVRNDCRHCWSIPDEHGVQWCAWCDAKTGREALVVQP